MKKLFMTLLAVLVFPVTILASDWQHFGVGAMATYTLTLSADTSAATVLPGSGEYAGTYMLPVMYEASADDAVVLTLHPSSTSSIDMLNGNGTVADATTGGYISPNDRWWISGPLYYELSGLGAGTVTFTFAVAKDK